MSDGPRPSDRPPSKSPTRGPGGYLSVAEGGLLPASEEKTLLELNEPPVRPLPWQPPKLAFKGAHWKLTSCPDCATSYRHPISDRGELPMTLFRDELDRDTRDVLDSLERLGMVPCPGCGRYPEKVVADYRRRLVKKHIRVTASLTTLPLLCLAVHSPLALFLAGGSAVLVSGGLTIARHLTLKRYDPNHDLERNRFIATEMVSREIVVILTPEED